MNADPPAKSEPVLAWPWRRILLFYVLWIILAGTGKEELWVGIPAAVLSGWLSAKLLPSRGCHWSLAGVARLFGRFMRDSVVAGVEVAFMAFRPEMRLNPGIFAHQTLLPDGGMRAFFNTYNTLMPGTLAVEPKDGDHLQFHCLDVETPVGAALSEYETLLLQSILRKGGTHG